jgi:hypothetical protein
MTEVEKIVSRAKVGRRLLVAVVALTCLGTVYAIAVNVGQSTDITNVNRKIEKSACASNPSHPSAECEHIRQQVDLHESVIGACIIHQRATGNKGANCSRFYVDVSAGGGAPTGSGSGSSGELAPAGQGHKKSAENLTPGHGEGGSASPPHHPETKTPAPESSPAAPVSAPTHTEAAQEPTSAGETTLPVEPTPKHPILEGAGTITEGAGEVVAGVGETVTRAPCKLGPLLCPK